METLDKTRVIDKEQLRELWLALVKLMDEAAEVAERAGFLVEDLDSLCAGVPSGYENNTLKSQISSYRGTFQTEPFTTFRAQTEGNCRRLEEHVPDIDKYMAERLDYNRDRSRESCKRIQALTALVYNGELDRPFENFQQTLNNMWLAEGGEERISADYRTSMEYMGICPLCVEMGDPVNTSNGNFLYDRTDLTIPGRTPLTVKRFYNAQDATKGVLGRSWRHSYERRILRKEDGSGVLELPDGKKLPFDVPEELMTEEDGNLCYRDAGGNSLFFNAGGQCVCQENPQGGRIIFCYDTENRLSRAQSDCGTFLQYRYNRRGRLTEVEDHTGRMVRYTYEESRLSRVCDELGQLSAYEYGDNNRLQTIRNERDDRLVRNTYDDIKRVICQQTADGSEITFRYQWNRTIVKQDGQALCICRRDGQGRTIAIERGEQKEAYAYLAAGERILYRDGAGAETRTDYDGSGRRSTEHRADGTKRSFAYDGAGRLKEVTEADGSRRAFHYDEEGRLCAAKQAGAVRQYAYDKQGRLSSITYADGGVDRIAYDERSNISSVRPADGECYDYTYDALNRLRTVTDTDGNAVTLTYDARNRLTSRTDRRGRTQTIAYTECGDISRVTRPDAGSIEITYDAGRRVVCIREADGVETRYEYGAGELPLKRSRTLNGQTDTVTCAYDTFGRRTMIQTAGGTLRYAYDNADRCTVLTQENAETGAADCLRFEYDACGRCTRILKNDTEALRCGYDACGRTISMQGKEEELQIAYDLQGRIISLRDRKGNSLRQLYDGAGNMTERAIREAGKEEQLWSYTYAPGGRLTQAHKKGGETVRYTYDSAGRLTDVEGTGGRSRHTAYDSQGRIKRETDGAGGSVNYAYDEQDRLSVRRDTRGNSTSYRYDARGRLLAVEESGNRTEYRYDENGSLCGTRYNGEERNTRTWKLPGRIPSAYLLEKEEPLPGTGFEKEEKDSFGRVVRRSFGCGMEAVYGYGAEGRLETLCYTDREGELDSFRYRYDGEGNMTQKESRRRGMEEESGSYRYGYDAWNRLTEVEKDGRLLRRYGYDALGNRTLLEEHAGTDCQEPVRTTYQYKDQYLLEREESLAGTRYFEYDETGRMLTETPEGREACSEASQCCAGEAPKRNTGEQDCILLTDHLGSPIRSIDRAGRITGSYGYDEFGRTTAGGEGKANVIPLATGYAGYRTRADGSYRAGVRIYEPGLGRFRSPDPVSGYLDRPQSQNPYTYVENNPLTYVDRTGARATAVGSNYLRGGSDTASGTPYGAAQQAPPEGTHYFKTRPWEHTGSRNPVYPEEHSRNGFAHHGCTGPKTFGEALYEKTENITAVKYAALEKILPDWKPIQAILNFRRGVENGILRTGTDLISGVEELPETTEAMMLNLREYGLNGTGEMMGHAAGMGIVSTVDTVTNGTAESRGELVGRIIGEIALAVAGAKAAGTVKGAGASDDIERVTRLAGGTDDLADAAGDAGKVLGAADDVVGMGLGSVDDVIEGGSGVKAIETPYGQAIQDISDEALGVRQYVEQGGDLYRGGTLGRSNTTDAQFWATENPLTPGYADKYGVDFDNLDYVIKGNLKQGTDFVTRPAPGLGNNVGGAIEVVTPPNSVSLDYFHMLGGK